MAAKTTKPAPRARRNRQEVQEEMESIRTQRAAETEQADSKSDEIERRRVEDIRAQVEGLTVDGVVQTITSLGLDVSRALGGLSESLVAQVRLLSSVQEAVRLERTEIERVHQIDIAKTSLDQLLQDHARSKQELETEIEAARAAWEQETRERERRLKEEDETLKKQRQRETEDYEYRKTLERKKAQDKHDEEMRLLEKQNKEKQEKLEKGWQERESTLRTQEDELARLRQESAGFAERLKRECDRVAKESTQATEARLKQEILLASKEMEAEKRLAESKIKSLEETIGRLNEQIGSLQKQADEAKKQVQDIALKAIEGAAGANALAHINKIAMEQAKQRSPQS
jgi:colicin import membrane protein